MDVSASGYLEHSLGLCHEAADAELPQVVDAAQVIAKTLMKGGRWWLFGTGHSHLLVEELWGRAGGLVDLHPILEPGLMLHEGLDKSSRLERLSGLASTLAELHPVGRGDVLLVISNSGRNAVPVEFARIARDRGTTVIAVTSLTHSTSVESRVPSGEKLVDVAHIVIDNHGVVGDASIPREGGAVGPTSTVVGALLLQALAVEVIGILDRAGHPPQVHASLNG